MGSAAFRILKGDGGLTLALSGDWTSLTLDDNAMRLPSELSGASQVKQIDLSDLERLDTAGAYVIMRAAGFRLTDLGKSTE